MGWIWAGSATAERKDATEGFGLQLAEGGTRLGSKIEVGCQEGGETVWVGRES